PKSASYGGVPRLRISSQALKRAARLSNTMQTDLKGHLGDRTQRIGEVIRDTLRSEGVAEDAAGDIAEKVTDVFGKIDETAKKDGKIRTRQLAFISPEEREAAIELARTAAAGEALPDTKQLKKTILRTADGAADVAMFGRMLADDPDFNREAAVQVSHALTTHRALVEDDFYTAVDDLKHPSEDAGAGFVGEAGFGSGVFYTYACVDVDLLKENLGGEAELAATAAAALAEALAVSTPSGKRNSFAHQTRASFIRAEKGDDQPRSLAGAFLKPVEGEDPLSLSVEALNDLAAKMDAAYGLSGHAPALLDVEQGVGTLADIKAYAKSAVSDG
ncbi:MAG: type I-E CRISPR-associated protein Cas7/Cse4/CasC, partial [Pseudomonadota bacterium]